MDDKTAELLNKVVDNTSSFASKLTETMETLAPQAWDILVWSARVDGIIAACLVLVSLGILFFCHKKATDLMQKSSEASYPDEMLPACAAGCFAIGGLVALCCAVETFVTAMKNILVPEMAALEQLISLMN